MTELMTAEQAHIKSVQYRENKAIQTIMRKILHSCELGEFSTTLCGENTVEIPLIEKTLLELGYTIKTTKERYVGSFKERVQMKITW